MTTGSADMARLPSLGPSMCGVTARLASPAHGIASRNATLAFAIARPHLGRHGTHRRLLQGSLPRRRNALGGGRPLDAAHPARGLQRRAPVRRVAGAAWRRAQRARRAAEEPRRAWRAGAEALQPAPASPGLCAHGQGPRLAARAARVESLGGPPRLWRRSATVAALPRLRRRI